MDLPPLESSSKYSNKWNYWNSVEITSSSEFPRRTRLLDGCSDSWSKTNHSWESKSTVLVRPLWSRSSRCLPIRQFWRTKMLTLSRLSKISWSSSIPTGNRCLTNKKSLLEVSQQPTQWPIQGLIPQCEALKTLKHCMSLRNLVTHCQILLTRCIVPSKIC